MDRDRETDRYIHRKTRTFYNFAETSIYVEYVLRERF